MVIFALLGLLDQRLAGNAYGGVVLACSAYGHVFRLVGVREDKEVRKEVGNRTCTNICIASHGIASARNGGWNILILASRFSWAWCNC